MIGLRIRFSLKRKGVTLIELLIALVVSGILIGALYRTLIRQQKTYTVQEQVVDMQQNVRAAIHKMMREIRMAGFGNIGVVLNLAGGVNGFTQVITPGNDTITVVGGYKEIRRDNGDPIRIDSIAGNQLTLNYATEEFDRGPHRFISIGGVESNTVRSRSGKVLTLDFLPTQAHFPGTPIFKIQAITYGLRIDGPDKVLFRNENTGGGRQTVAENIENVLFTYFDAMGAQTVNPADIRMIGVSITAKTGVADPELKGGDGFRRRQIATHIQLRNRGLSP